MSFLDDLFGGGAARRDAAASFRDSEALRASGRAQADALLAGTLDDQLAALRSGNDTAVGAINQGYDTARGDLTTGYDTARSDIGLGYDRAIDTENDALARIRALFNPYIEDGNAAGDRYQTAIGLNGDTAQRDYLDTYETSDPFRDFNEEMANKSIISANNAAGRKFAPATDLALSRASLERGSQDYNSHLDRLMGLYQMAADSSGRLAGYESSTGARVAGYEQGRGTDLGNNAVGKGTSLGNNAVGRGTALGNQANTNATNIASLQGQQAQERANLAYGDAQVSANNRISLGNANAATRGMGANNLLRLAGTAIQGFTPGVNGVSAVGNISNMIGRLS